MEILNQQKFRRSGYWFAILIALTALETSKAPAATPCPAAANTAPVELDATTLAGKPTSIATLRGQAVLIDVWATWCSACRTTLIAANKLADGNQAGNLAVVGLSVDRDLEDARRWLQETLPETALRGWQANPSETFAALDIRALPATVLLDAQGRIIARHEGSEATGLNELLAQARACGQTSG